MSHFYIAFIISLQLFNFYLPGAFLTISVATYSSEYKCVKEKEAGGTLRLQEAKVLQGLWIDSPEKQEV